MTPLTIPLLCSTIKACFKFLKERTMEKDKLVRDVIAATWVIGIVIVVLSVLF
jgi:hypothetical protein